MKLGVDRLTIGGELFTSQKIDFSIVNESHSPLQSDSPLWRDSPRFPGLSRADPY
jgi:hypothetical protein